MTLRLCLLLTILVGPVTVTTAEEPTTLATVQRAVGFLEADMAKWRADHNCASCHHGPFAVWSLQAAKRAGAKIDDANYEETLNWLLTSDKARLLPGEADAKTSIASVYFGIALQHVPATDAVKAARQRIERHLVATQKEDGGWLTPAGRPPLLLTVDESHDWVRWSLGNSGDPEAKVVESRRRADALIAATKIGDDLPVLLARMLHTPVPLPAEQTQTVLNRQNADGGWSQTPTMASDGLATGMALTALRHAAVKSDDPALGRAVTFLMKSQREDGSWAMTSRPHPENKSTAKNLIPITYPGSAWAVIGLSSVLTP
ncbi:MAG: prenyltransferase/squalene oxidase repeat-containing protein [Planctomycetota bacterium]